MCIRDSIQPVQSLKFKLCRFFRGKGDFMRRLLSVCSDERIQEYINETEFTRLTDTTITSGNALFAEVQKVREQGYAVDNEESEIGLV